MSSKLSARIIGTGSAVPPKVVTNKDLEALMDTSDEWIQQRTGIKERRYVDDDVTPSDLAAEAAEAALNMAKVDIRDIDLLLVATLSPEHYFPGTASFLQRKLQMGNTPAMDIRNQCSGFLYGLSTANAFITSGQYRRILLVGVEVHSRGLDMTTRGRDVSVLFGDGAGAVVVEAEDQAEQGILSVKLHSDGQGAEKLWVQYPSNATSPHISGEIVEAGGVYPQMDGRFVFKHAVQKMPEVVGEALQDLHLGPQDIDMYLFHQANLRINEHVAGTLGVSADRMHNNIDRYGNCSAASIPLCLDECVRAGKIERGNLVCMTAFGSGFTWGSAILRW